jgi:hypothetical protein
METMSNRKGELVTMTTITNLPKRSLSNIILMLTSQWIAPALFVQYLAVWLQIMLKISRVADNSTLIPRSFLLVAAIVSDA